MGMDSSEPSSATRQTVSTWMAKLWVRVVWVRLRV